MKDCTPILILLTTEFDKADNLLLVKSSGFASTVISMFFLTSNFFRIFSIIVFNSFSVKIVGVPPPKYIVEILSLKPNAFWLISLLIAVKTSSRLFWEVEKWKLQ